MEFALGLAAALLTQLVAFWFERKRHERAEAAERRRRVEQREEEAAEELLNAFIDLPPIYREAWRDAPAEDKVEPPTTAIRRKLALLSNPAARRRLTDCAEVLENTEPFVQGQEADPPPVIAYVTCQEGQEIAGSILRQEPLPEQDPRVAAYHQSVKAYERYFEEELRKPPDDSKA